MSLRTAGNGRGGGSGGGRRRCRGSRGRRGARRAQVDGDEEVLLFGEAGEVLCLKLRGGMKSARRLERLKERKEENQSGEKRKKRTSSWSR
jgi:hypothetical protein